MSNRIIVKAQDARIKAHGKVSTLSALGAERLPNGRVLVTLFRDNGKQMAGGIILGLHHAGSLAEAIHDLQLADFETKKAVKTVRMRRAGA